MLVTRVRLLIATLWAGSLWTIGYMVAPTLFVTLTDRALAGSVAGSLFRAEAWLSVFCAVVLIVFGRPNLNDGEERARKRRSWLVLGMLGCTAIGYFGLHPFMAALREAAGAGAVMESGVRMQFAMLHGASSALYLTQSLLAVALVLKIR